jgi:hypothetical protein
MRYYDILVLPTGADANNLTPEEEASGRHWTSLVNGQNDPGALNVQFDIFEAVGASPMGSSTVTIEGVPLTDLLQASQFGTDPNGRPGMQIAIRAGMSKGLPLANPAQAGLILQGQIFQSFGNWVGTEMTLDFVIVPSVYTTKAPGNLVLNWKKGSSLASALAQTLSVAYPGYAQVINIGPQYVLSHDVLHSVGTFTQLATMVKSISNSIKPPGVDLAVLRNKTIAAFDGSIQTGGAVQLAFTDLIGQPTWVDQNLMQFWTIMRADIQVGSYVLMPKGLQDLPGIVGTAADSLPSSLKYKTSFQGKFLVTAVRQVGNFRDTNGASWATLFQAAAQKLT